MTTMTVAVRDVAEYEAFPRRSILLTPQKSLFRYQKFSSWQHSRPFILLLCTSFRYLLQFVP